MSSSPRVYWINLDSNHARREHMSVLLTRHGFQHTRVPGLYPDIFPHVIIQPPLRTPSPAEVGCTLSHLKALWMAVSQHPKREYDDDEYFLVMEDDVVFPFAVNVDKIIRETIPAKEWDVLQLFTNNPHMVPFLYKEVYLPHRVFWTPWMKYHYSTLCYAIKYKVAKQLILRYQFFNTGKPVSFDAFVPLDQIAYNAPISDLIMYHGLRSFTITVPVMHALDQDSHIHPEHLDMHKTATQHVKDILQRDDYRGLIYAFSVQDFESKLVCLRDILSALTPNYEVHVSEDIVVPNAIHWNVLLSMVPSKWNTLHLYTQSVKVAKDNLRNYANGSISIWVPWCKKYKGGAFMIKNNKDQGKCKDTNKNTDINTDKDHGMNNHERVYVLAIPIAYREHHDESMREFMLKYR